MLITNDNANPAQFCHQSSRDFKLAIGIQLALQANPDPMALLPLWQRHAMNSYIRT